MKKFFILYIFLFFTLLASQNAFSSHIAGGNISYQCLPDGRIVVTLTLFRDCAGITPSSSQSIDVLSSCGASLFFSLPQVETEEVSQLCDSEMGNSACNGGTLPGMEAYVYRDTITLAPACDDWTISWTTCCRNDAITNFDATSSANDDIYLEAEIHNMGQYCNTSPEFTSPPIPYVCTNTTVTYNYGVYDVDGDSLVFSLVPALDGPSAPVNYNSGYSGSSPIPGMTIDSNTGEITFANANAGNYVVVVQVEEYSSNGDLLSVVMREIQFVVIACNNNPPEPSAGLANTTGSASVNGNVITMQCPGEDICFDISFTDVDVNQNLTISSNIDSLLTGAVITTSGTNPLVVNVCYTYQPGDRGGSVVFIAEDESCPIPGLATFTVFFDLPQATYAFATEEKICGNMVSQLIADNGNTFTWSVISGDPIVVGSNFSCNPCANPVAQPSQTTTYVVTSDLAGCINSDTVTIEVVDNLGGIYAIAGPDTSVCLGNCYQMLSQALEDINEVNNYTFSGNAGQNIISNQTVTSPASVSGLSAVSITPGQFYVSSVCLDITHTWDSDLDIYLECPDGTQFELSTDNGGSSDNYTNTCFTVNATTPITSGSAPFTGNYLPEGGNLANAFAGCPLNGTWNLVVGDDVGGDDGTLNSWSLTFEEVLITTTNTTNFNWNTGAYMDNPNSITPTICPTQDTSYILTVYDNFNCFTSDTVNITVAPPFNYSITGTDATCYGVSNGTAIITPEGTLSEYTYTWDNGQTTNNADNLSPTLHCVTVSNTACTQVACVTISTLGGFVVTVSGTNPTCNGFSDGEAFSTVTGGTTPYTYTWSNGETTDAISALTQGTYALSVTSSEGCFDRDTIILTNPPVPTITPVTITEASCWGLCDAKALITVTSGTMPFQFIWSSGNTTAYLDSALCAGSYNVIVVDTFACSDTLNFNIIEPDRIVVNVSGDDTICFNNSATIYATPSGGNGDYLFNWENGLFTTDTITIYPIVPTTYTVQVTDKNGCTGDTSYTVFVRPPLSSSIPQKDTICSGDSIILSINISGGDGKYSALWQPTLGINNVNALNPKVSPAYTTTYQVTITDGCNSPAITDEIKVIVGEYPSFRINPPTVSRACSPIAAELSVDTIQLGYQYLWNYGDGKKELVDFNPVGHLYTKPGCYDVSLVVTSDLGCADTVMERCLIKVYPNPKADFSLSNYEPTLLNPAVRFINNSDIGNKWEWDFGDGETSDDYDPLHIYEDTGKYLIRLVMMTQYGCVDTAEFELYVDWESEVYIPNAFTPDGDGFNEEIGPKFIAGTEFENYEWIIFNRFGEIIFQTTDPHEKWNGAVNNSGSISPSGVYVYRMVYQMKGGKGSNNPRWGTITLLK
ncbi:MAG: hypothetical protein D6707_07460 [Bacteroidetes bacterium]|nr:MAG: hypothetical protein D6707_07460 [Bacteroidota bacterium]